MTKYDYMEAMKNDIKEYIENEIDFADFDELEELEEKLNDDLWTVDSVTGNASGSYTFNRHKAMEYVLDNIEHIKEACEEFCYKDQFAEKFFSEEWEWMDVTIRCYLLGYAISFVMEDIREDFEASKE